MIHKQNGWSVLACYLFMGYFILIRSETKSEGMGTMQVDHCDLQYHMHMWQH